MTCRVPAIRVWLLRGLICAALAGTATTDLRTCRAGKLDAVRSEVAGDSREDDPPDRGKSTRRASHDCDDDPPGFFRSLTGDAIVFTTTAPWWLPRFALGDEGQWATFPPAPYAQGHPGYLVVDAVDPIGTDSWSARLSTDYGTDFGDLSRIGTRLVIDTSGRFGFDAEWNQWLENTPVGEDQLATGDFNLVYRFAQHEQVQFHSGLGVNWLADDNQADLGVNFTYGVDLFPADPLVISAVMDIGSLGDAFLVHVRSTAGIVWGPAEVFAGYDYQRIGAVDLQGLLAGIRIWF